MKNGYQVINLLLEKLNSPVLTRLINSNKNDFSKNETLINIAVGYVNEIKNIINSIDEDFYILNQKLYELTSPIKVYGDKLINNYGFVNSYKLYDCISIDILSLKNYLSNKINDK